MARKGVLILLMLFFALAAILLSLWLKGAFRQEIPISEVLANEIKSAGIVAEFNIEPQAGILPGDVLRISLAIFYDSESLSVSLNKLKEEYITLKEKGLAGCEERMPAKLTERKTKRFTQIVLSAQFQCWITEAHETSLGLAIQYTKTATSDTSTLQAYERIGFVSPPKSGEPQGLASYSRGKNTFWILLTSAAGAVILLEIIFLLILRNKPKAGLSARDLEKNLCQRYASSIEKIKSLAYQDPHDAYDKLFHLCVKIGVENEIVSPRLQPIKEKVRRMYGSKPKIQEIHELMRELENILNKGGGAT